ncbi:uncharacterized protein MONOS_17244 [Monocercomonoides exilis]|uniref:uncharacterized protein n=1 Tax=Monocercomonoides exilis TaxID=2049356 RepID=UPI003559823B|nr:hypothetical protein MONOS_17244 [Monocercomonoides exilis]
MQMGAGQALLAIMETIMLCSGAGVFGDVCAGDGPCAVLLTAPWCGACGEAEAAVEEAREHFSGMVCAVCGCVCCAAQNGTGLVRQVEFHVVRDAHRQAGRNQQLMVAELPALFVVEEGKAVPFEGMFTGPVVTEFVSEVVGKEAREIERETLEAMHRGGGAGGPSSIVLVGSDLGSSEALRLKRGLRRLGDVRPEWKPFFFSEDKRLCELFDAECGKAGIYAYGGGRAMAFVEESLGEGVGACESVGEGEVDVGRLEEWVRKTRYAVFAPLSEVSVADLAERGGMIVMTVIPQKEKAIYRRMKEVMMAVSEMLPSVQFVHVDPTVSGGATSSSMLPLSGAAGLATGSSTLFSLLSREALDLRDVPVVCVVDVGRGVHFLERELDVLSVGSVGRWVQDVVAGKVKSVEEEMMEARGKGAERGVLEKEKEKEEKEEEEEEEEKIEEEKKEIEGGKEEEEGEVEWVKSNVGVGVVCGVCGVAGGMILSRGSGSGKKERKKTREGKGGKEGKGEADTENEEDKDDDGDEDGDGDENEEEEEEEEGIKKKGKGEETENKKKKKKKGKEGKGGKERKEGKEGKGKAKEN